MIKVGQKKIILSGKTEYSCEGCSYLYNEILKTGRNPIYNKKCSLLKIELNSNYSNKIIKPHIECPFLKLEVRNNTINDILE